MIRYWQLPGGITAKEEPTEPIGWNFFWYCAHCGEIYARAWTTDGCIPWQARGGCCPRCPGSKWSIPGSLETISFVGWKVPVVVARYQVERELAFLRSDQHPYNEKDENE